MVGKADRVFINAKIYSVELDGTETRAEALSIKDGKFVYVGTNEGVKEYIDDKTQITDCKGNSILPGFGDAHMHFAISVRRFGVADVSKAITDMEHQTVNDAIKNICDIVKKYVSEHPDAPVIHGSGWELCWFTGALGGMKHEFSFKDIDDIAPDKPIVLDSADGHICMLNKKAMELAGINKDTEKPKAGILKRFEDGTPTGWIQEPVLIAPVCQRIPNFDFTDKEQIDAFIKAQEFFASKGFTLLSDCMEQPHAYDLILEMAKKGDIKVRIDGVFNINDETREDDIKKAIAKKGKYDYEDLLKVDTVKYFSDGNFAMLEPYEEGYRKEKNLPDNAGMMDGMLWDVEHMKDSMNEVQKEGFNIHVHSFGDLSTRLIIDCMEDAQKNYNKDQKLRNIIAHCSFVNDIDKKRMGENHIIGSIQPQWECESVKSNPMFDAMLGKRFESIYPNKSLLDAGVVCAYGSDFTVNYPLPLDGVTIAMTRKIAKSDQNYETYKNEAAMMPSECVSLKETIKGWTIAPAYQFHRENITGSIKVGKSAELILLNGDIENTKVEDICLLKVVETVFKGNTIYKI